MLLFLRLLRSTIGLAILRFVWRRRAGRSPPVAVLQRRLERHRSRPSAPTSTTRLDLLVRVDAADEPVIDEITDGSGDEKASAAAAISSLRR